MLLTGSGCVALRPVSTGTCNVRGYPGENAHTTPRPTSTHDRRRSAPWHAGSAGGLRSGWCSAPLYQSRSRRPKAWRCRWGGRCSNGWHVLVPPASSPLPPMMNADINSPYVHDPVYLGAAHDENARRTLWVVALTRVMMVAEITAGDLTGSMAWLADGFHMAHPCRCVGHHRIRLRLCQAPCQQPVLQLQHRQARRCNPHRPACLAQRQSSPCRCGSAQGKRPDSPPAMRSA